MNMKLFGRLLGLSKSYNYYKSNYDILKRDLSKTKSKNIEISRKLESSYNEINSFQECKKEIRNILNDINTIKIQNNLYFLKEKFKNNIKINIVFIVNFRLTVIDSFVKLLDKDPKFKATIVVIPYDTYSQNIFDKGLSEHQLIEYETNYKHFKTKGFNVVKGYDPEQKTLIDLESELDPDLLFYSTHWETSFPEQYRIKNLPSNIIYCYIPYGIHAAAVEHIPINFELFSKSWKIFYPTKIHAKIAAQESSVGSSNVVVTGYPKMDPLLDGSHEQSTFRWIDQNHDKKRIIWAPHHSINTYINFSTFDKNYKFFYDLAKEYTEIEWVFKPHPNLYYYLISFIDSEEFSEEKVNEYYNAWNKLPNASLCESGNYLNVFATSDAMITDCVSFLSEYLYSGHPGLFLTNEKQRFNEYGDIIKKAWYSISGEDFESIKNFINGVVINNKDPLKNDREKIFNDYLKPANITASEKIHQNIRNSLK